MTSIQRGLAAAMLAAGLLAGAAQAQAPTKANAAQIVPPAVESAIRKNLVERLPNIGQVDEVRTTPIAGLYEVRVEAEIFYTDAEGQYLLNGHLIDTRTKRNITEERQDKLLAVKFDSLPVKDAFVVVRGNGKRKVAMFQDPNCGYCKRMERDLQKIDNVTVYMYLYPILGPDSVDKSRNIWCTKDKGKAWVDWMVRGEPTAKADASCDAAAVARNVEFGKKHRITGTPTLIFADGSRVPGAIAAADFEKLLATK
jgi:thiol:disulfide interchange protein DsbC